jgi:hypothetical protein
LMKISNRGTKTELLIATDFFCILKLKVDTLSVAHHGQQYTN